MAKTSLESWWHFTWFIGRFKLTFGPCFDWQPARITGGQGLKYGVSVDDNHELGHNRLGVGGSLTVRTSNGTAKFELNTNLDRSVIQRSASIKTNSAVGVNVGIQATDTESAECGLEGWQILRPTNFFKKAQITVSHESIGDVNETEVSVSVLPLETLTNKSSKVFQIRETENEDEKDYLPPTDEALDTQEMQVTLILQSDQNMEAPQEMQVTLILASDQSMQVPQELLNFIMPTGSGRRSSRQLIGCQTLPPPDITKNHIQMGFLNSVLAFGVSAFFIALLYQFLSYFEKKDD